ncbi:MAG: WD40 repeat domain-containing protein [Verrucomicrobiae bacterium]|nr:WD40 repeat domain-containing protein [Verrucomicrobiae bacterium]
MKWIPSSRWLIIVLAMVGIELKAQPSVRVTHERFETWLKGEPQGVTLGEEGVLSSGWKLESALKTNFSVKVIWSAVRDSQGNTFLAAGDEGKIFKVSPVGELMEWAKLKESQVTALVWDAKGVLYAATAPDGKVYRVNGKELVEEYFDPKEKYIWALLWKGNDLYVATGTEGKLYRVTALGQGEVFYDSNEPNLRCLAQDKNGDLLVGTEGKGLVLQVKEKGKALALFDAPRKEIRQIAVDENGRIAFAALGLEAASKPQRTKINPPQTEDKSANEKLDNSKNANQKSDAMNSFLKGGTPSLSQERGEVYQLEQPGFATVLWSADASPQALLRYRGEWLIGTGDDGFLYGVSDRGEKRVVARAESNQITVLVSNQNNLFAATSNDGGWWALKAAGGDGIYQSEVIDSQGFSRWGALRVKGEVAHVRTRSGNTVEPDKTWYDWVELKDQKVVSPAARYLQYELSLKTGSVRRVDVFYTPKNLAPRINAIVALPSGIGYAPMTDPPQPPQQKTLQQLLNWDLFEMPSFDRTRMAPELRGGLQTIVWSASDPNPDQLTYQLSYRRENEKDFKVLEKELEVAAYTLDTIGWEDGIYYFKVSVTDKKSNETDPLSDEKISEGILIDNTAPQIEKMASDNGVITFRARDQGSLIWDVMISRDGVEFAEIQPKDGVLDSSEEIFEAKVSGGEKLFIRVQDEAGNLASANYNP